MPEQKPSFQQIWSKIQPFLSLCSQKIKQGFSAFLAYCQLVGEQILYIISYYTQYIVYELYHFFHHPGRRFLLFFRRRKEKTVRFCKKLGRAFVSPFLTLYRGFVKIRNTVHQYKKQPLQCIKQVFAELGKGLFRHSHIFVTLFHYALPVAGVAIFIAVVQIVTAHTFAIQVTYADEVLGYVQSEATIESAKKIVQDRMVYLDESEHVEIDPIFSIELHQEEPLTEYALADAMIRLSSDDMTEAEGLYVNDEFQGAIVEAGLIEDTLEEILKPYLSMDNIDSVNFVDTIRIVKGLYLTDHLQDADVMVDYLTGDKVVDAYYTIRDGDTPSGVADELDMDYDELKRLNPDIEEVSVFQPGNKLLIAGSEANLPVQVEKTVTYTQKIAHKTKVTESDDYIETVRKVTQEGKDGKKRITAKVIYVDGMEVDREILKTKVISKAVTEEIIQGTAPITINVSGTTGSGRPSSGFVWPMSGYVSSHYGYRWGTLHAGMDIARYGGAYGAPIYAASNGTVIYSQYHAGGYGNLIKIDHGNGLQTWYAHCSALYASVGQKVSAGTQIAAAGETGQAYGAHLHFEVRVNGTPYDPRSYLP